MKSFFVLLLLTLLSSEIINAQTINPSCYSNAVGWKITKVENNYDGTYVYLNFYSYKQNYEFWIVSGMYIENYNSPNTKYYVKGFVNNQLNTKYKLEPFTEYDFILKFDKIPSLWTDINIKEPYQGTGLTSWYWNYISLNKPENNRLKFDNLILNNGIELLSNFAHPLNTFRKVKYNVDYDKARVTVYYKDYTIDLRLVLSGDYIKKIEVIYDDDYDKNSIWAFSGLQLMRNAIFKQSNYNKDISTVEQLIGKYINQMSGEELATALLDLIILMN